MTGARITIDSRDDGMLDCANVGIGLSVRTLV